MPGVRRPNPRGGSHVIKVPKPPKPFTPKTKKLPTNRRKSTYT